MKKLNINFSKQRNRKALFITVSVLSLFLLFNFTFVPSTNALIWDDEPGDGCPDCDIGDGDDGDVYYPPTCSDQCSYGQRTCVDSTHYKICGNYDGDPCLEWSSSYYCGTGKICQNGQCVTQYNPHSYKSCYDNDVYWYDSNNVRNDKATECGTWTWTDDYQCSGSYLQREWLQRGCSNGACFETPEWYNQEDCGTDSWTNNYQCSGTVIQRQKHKEGCSSNSCYDYYQWEDSYDCALQGKTCQNGQCVTQCVSHSYKQCWDSDVYWYNSCNSREDKATECGIDSWTNNYQCSGNWIQRQEISRGCSGSDCYENTQWVNYQDCAVDGKTCSNGQCITQYNPHSYKSCYDNDVYWYDSNNVRNDKATECGTWTWTDDYQCSGSYLQREWLQRGCSNGACFETPEWYNQEDCGTDSWTNNYQCSGTVIQRQKHKEGCSSNSCYDYYQWEDSYDCAVDGKTCSNGQCVTEYDSHSYKSCYDNDVYWYDSNNVRNDKATECGTWTWTDDYQCSGSYLQREWLQRGCSNGACFETPEWYNQEDCGTDSWTNNYQCSGTVIQRQKHKEGCSSNSCYDYYQWEDSYDCAVEDRTCTDGQCRDECEDECAYSGQLRCYNSTSKQTCGNYDSDSCLEWSSARSCTGSTYCGYGKCDSHKRPRWYCSGGTCEYNCYYSSSCDGGYDEHDYRQCYNNDVYWYDSNNNRQDKYKECNSDYCGSWGSNYCSGGDVYKSRTCYDRGCSGSSCYSDKDTEKKLVERCDDDETCKSGKCVSECECSSGPCCDGCNYKDDTKICKTTSQTQYGCPWGTLCGADTGERTRLKFQYCSGDDSDCDGSWGSWRSWSSWTVNDYCSNTERCSAGDPTCDYSSSCVYTPSYNTKQCYDNDVYWFSQAGTRLSKYMECDDNNTCTLDRCGTNKCYHDLKCDGSTCGRDSSDYCASCEHCGDGVVNCDEDFCSCSDDCAFPGDVSEAEEEEEGIEGAAAVGGIFGRIIGIIGNVAFSIAMLFLLMLMIILFMISYYSFKKKKAEQFV